MIKIIDHIGNPTVDNLPTVHILHGIHRDDASTGPGNWAKHYTQAGFNVKVWDYGHVYAWNARFFVNPKVVKRLFKEFWPGDILVGHSNGCAIIADAVDNGLLPGGVVLLNPALDDDRLIQSPFVHVYCNEDDTAVWWGQWLFSHPYGTQGRNGPNFDDPAYSVFYGEVPPAGLSIVSGHSHINDKKTLETWGPFGVNKVVESILTIDAFIASSPD